MPIIVPNFIAVGQTVCEKSVTIFTPSFFWRHRGAHWAIFHQCGRWCTARPLYQTVNFRPVLTTPLRDTCCQSLSISLTAWRTKITSASVKDWCMSPRGIAWPTNKSSPISGNKCPLPRPITLPNFVTLRQTMYEKSVTIFTPVFLRPRGTAWPTVHQSWP